MNAIIIDDEEDCREVLDLLLKKHCPEVTVLKKAASALSGMNAIIQYRPQLVFLDIEMHKGSGFELLDNLPEVKFEVVFTTAYDQYALKAIKFNALDYLLKPIDYTELKVAVKKAKSKLLGRKAEAPPPMNKVAIPTSSGLKLIEVKDILRCESSNSYTYVFTENGESTLISKSLKGFEEILVGFNFFRLHQSHLVNLQHVCEYSTNDGGTVVLTDKSVVPIAKRKKEAFLAELKKYRV